MVGANKAPGNPAEVVRKHSKLSAPRALYASSSENSYTRPYF